MTAGSSFVLRIGLVAVFVTLAAAVYISGAVDHLDWAAVRANWTDLRAAADRNPAVAPLAFIAVYVGVTALSLPVAAPLTILGGALFGRWVGAGAAAVGATIGATAAMLAARFVLRDWVAARFGHRLGGVNRGVERDGAYYLLSLRLMPLVPFWLVNLAVGLTPMRVRTFAAVSLVGMLPGAFLFANAGTALAEIESPKDLLTANVIGAFALLALVPLLVRWAIGPRTREGES